MDMDRREFVKLTTSAAFGLCAGGCGQMADNADEGFAPPLGLVDAGSATAYVADGVYGGLADRGFFIIRKGESLSALSSKCTHRNCRLKPAAGHAFRCACHGSTFDPAGHVTKGPAKRDLPMLPLKIDANGHVIVEVTALQPAWK